MNKIEIMKEVSKMPLFKYLTPQEIDWMLVKWRPKEVPKETVIIREGTTGDEMYIIDAGRVEVFLTRGDVIVLLSELEESSFFGEMALLTGKTRSATVKAKTDCRLLILKKQSFLDIINENPKVAAKFLMGMCESLSNRILITNANLENYFLVNQAIVDNESFRNLYILTHKAPSSSG
ncbi:MAG: cyclic nucleotide-binding domain-containing protein [candidate division WOR-3 bacterium]|nr:MAG: cyclic nucleotide-binding domain-containing protein [candidate division WOR-3 bacterium]